MSIAAARSRDAYIGIGSNLDTPAAQIEEAIRRLDGSTGLRVVAQSSLYRSAPFGPVAQPDFVNAVAAVRTQLGPRSLLSRLQAIETSMGRRRDGERWGPRIIDLDLLVYGDTVIDAADLSVPHPGIAERNFVLLPLREIAPDLLVPGLGAISDLAVSASEPRIERLPAEVSSD